MKVTLATYEVQRVEVRPYDPRSPEVAAAVTQLVRKVLREPDLEPIHVGSSSIPEMPGKGYVDLDLLTPPERIPSVAERLVAAGFQRQTGLHAFPPSRPLLLAAAVTEDGARYPVHLHVTPDAREVARDVAFRDALRASADLRDRYEARKREVLASGIDFGPDYARAKSDVVRAILAEIEAPSGAD